MSFDVICIARYVVIDLPNIIADYEQVLIYHKMVDTYGSNWVDILDIGEHFNDMIFNDEDNPFIIAWIFSYEFDDNDDELEDFKLLGLVLPESFNINENENRLIFTIYPPTVGDNNNFLDIEFRTSDSDDDSEEHDGQNDLDDNNN